jgi:hypothetical protein
MRDKQVSATPKLSSMLVRLSGSSPVTPPGALCYRSSSLEPSAMRWLG